MLLIIRIVSFGIYFASLFSLLGAIGAIVIKPYRPVFMILYLLLISVWLFFGGSAAVGVKDFFPFNIFSAGFFCYSIAVPCIYFDFRKSLDHSFKLKLRHLPHVLCPLIVLIYVILFQYKYGSLYPDMSFWDIYYHSPGNIFFSGIVYIPCIAFFIEMILILHRTLRLRSTNTSIPSSSLRIIISSVLLNLFQCILWIIDKTFSLGWLWFLYLFSGSFIIAAFFVVLKDLNFILSLDKKKEKEKAQFCFSTLSNMDEERLLEKLKLLVSVDKVYYDEQLKLNSLASDMEITPHQLSELINTHFHMNFSSFINLYRIEEAKEILLSEPKRPIVNIGFDVGFNSSSSFYRAFKKELGISPADFRKKYIKAISKLKDF